MRKRAVRLFVVGIIVACAAGGGAYAEQAPKPALEGEPVPDSGQNAGAEQGESEPAQKPEEPERFLPAINAIESAIRELKAEDNTEERKRQIEREIADLHAQQEMALWAKCVTLATVAGVIITAVGLYFIWQSLRATRVTAEAAIEANRLNREAFINDQRAWLDAEVEIASDLVWIGDYGKLILILKMTNVGKSPAFDVIVRDLHEGDVARDFIERQWGSDAIFPMRTVEYPLYEGVSCRFARPIKCEMKITYYISLDKKRRHTIWKGAVSHVSWKMTPDTVFVPPDNVPREDLCIRKTGPMITVD